MSKFRIEIEGSPVTAQLKSLSITKEFNGRVSSASFKLASAPDPTQQTDVLISDATTGEKYFRGIVVKISRVQVDPSLFWTVVTCAGCEYLLDRVIINGSWTATKPRVIIQEGFGALTDFPITTDDATVDDVGSAMDFEAKDMTGRAFLDRMATLTGSEYRISEDLELFFRLAKTHAAPFSVDQGSPNGVTTFQCRKIGSSVDSVQFANHIEILGAYQDDGSDIRGIAEDADSIDAIGLRAVQLPMRDLTTQDAVDAAAALILENREEFVKGFNATFDMGIPGGGPSEILQSPQPGDMLPVVAPNHANLDETFQIQTVSIKLVTPDWREFSLTCGDFPGSLTERLRLLVAKAKNGTDGISPGTITPPYGPPGGPGSDPDCNCATECCHMRLERDCTHGFVVRMLALPVMYLKMISSAKTVYRSFFKNGAWTAKELVWNPASSSSNAMSTGADTRESACFGPSMIASGGGSAGAQPIYFIEQGQTPIDITPSGLTGQSLLAGFSGSNGGPWYHDGHWYALVYTVVGSAVAYLSVIKSALVTEAGHYRPSAGAWTVTGTGPNDGTLDGLLNAHVHYDGDDTITVWGRLSTSFTTYQFWDFTLSTGTWSSPYGSTTITGTNNFGGAQSLIKLPNGTRVVFYGKGSSTSGAYFRVYTESGATYGSEQQLDAGEEDLNAFLGALLDGDVIHTVYNSISFGTARSWFYRPVVAGVAGTKVALTVGVAGQNELYGGMLMWRRSLIIAITDPNSGSDGAHRTFHGAGGSPPTSFDEVIVDDSSEPAYGGMLGFALDPDDEGEIVASLGPDGLQADNVDGATGSGMANPMTTEGDLIVGAAGGDPDRLPIGSEDDVLTVVSGVPTWQAPAGGGSVDAADVTVTPAGGIAATDAQAALEELDAEKEPLLDADGVVAKFTGTPNGTKFLRDDGTLAVPSGGGGNAVTVSAFASLPSASGRADGDLHLCTDSPLSFYAVSAAWKARVFGYDVTPPVDGDFSWVNQGGASVSTTHGGVILADTGAGSLNLHLRVKSAPSTPYTVTYGFLPTLQNDVSIECGAVFRQSSDGKFLALRWIANAVNINWTKWDSPTSYNSDYLVTTTLKPDMRGPLVWFRLEDDGTNRKVYISSDGYNWILLHSVGRTDFLTADQIGFFIRADAGSIANYMHLLAFNVA